MPRELAGTLPQEIIARIAERTLANSNPFLIPYLTGSMNVLDVGCGVGGLTVDIARRVDPGTVVGIDRQEDVLERARAVADKAGMGNVMFLNQDIHDHELPAASFDVVTNSLLLHWMEDPETALREMAALAKSGGWVVTLDYDLTACRWYPEIPAFQKFFQAFCQWREEQGYNNEVGGHLPGLYRRVGLRSFQVHGALEVDHPLGPHYRFRTDIWTAVVNGRGPQMIRDGVLTNSDVQSARDEYTEWRENPDACQIIAKVFVAGRKA